MTVERIAAMVASLVVVASVVAGLMAVDSPEERRRERADERREADLTSLAWAIDTYWEQQGRLPDELGDLMQPGLLPRMRVDPMTNALYEYSGRGERYRLCAVFALESDRAVPEGTWDHPAGRHCFDLAPKKRGMAYPGR